MDIDALAEAARDLLLVAPADFVAERTARQRAARQDDRDLATAIGKLRKPAPAAWVVDLLAHDGALDEAVDLGPTIRDAQASADPQQIAVLRRQRSGVVAALAQAGADLASDAGHAAAPAVLDQVRATIEAAMADPHAGAAVRSGLLVRPLESAGFDDVDLDGALAVPDAVPDAWSGSGADPIPITSARRTTKPSRASRPEPEPEPEPEPDPEPARDTAADRRAARQAETAARAESRDADAALDRAETELDAAEQRRAQLQRDLDAATAEVARLELARDDAEAASDRARDLLAAARQHRRDLGR
ncbi:hypothetical protein DEJ13_04115 [Curtobacterium sp. MCLR17_007]|uniref:hypothetical protein n=1 Tax=Curtobacterium sp. MCLR17_007 TaxID=2175648 RepID=UPI000DA9C4BD|nr:hypothetical protein [Curtobacterium sp. MCLR17_007]WIB61028.1 hypothetical protein DEJ13_04115 [Curtobacterium sp. MCLR17_007]